MKELAKAAFPLFLDSAKQSFERGDFLTADKSLSSARELLAALTDEKPALSRPDANRKELVRLLEENDWNIAEVARMLEVTRRTLYMRLKAFNIERLKPPRLAKPII